MSHKNKVIEKFERIPLVPTANSDFKTKLKSSQPYLVQAKI